MASFDDRLDSAIDRLLVGLPPSDDPDIQPLLAAAAMVTSLRAPVAAGGRSRSRMQAALRAERARRSSAAGVWLRVGETLGLPVRWGAAVAATLAIALLFLLSGKALPGQAQYALKRGLETLPLLVSRQPDAIASHYTGLAERRLGEVEQLMADGQPVPIRLLEDVLQSWERAAAVPGADKALLLPAAERQSKRLQQFLPFLDRDLQIAAADALGAIRRAMATSTPPVPAPSPAPPRAETPPAAVSPSPTPTPISAFDTNDEGRNAPALTPDAATATPGPRPVATQPPAPPLTPTTTPGAASTAASPAPRASTPGPTQTPEPTETPEPSATAQRTTTATPRPDETDEPEELTEPTATRSATDTSEPTSTRSPAGTPLPTSTEEAERTREPTHTPEPEHTKEPTSTREPTHAPDPTHTPEPNETPDSDRSG